MRADAGALEPQVTEQLALPGPNVEVNHWIRDLAQPICSRLQRLRLSGETWGLRIVDLFDYDFPLLEKLSINLKDPQTVRSRSQTIPKRLFPSLVAIEAPGSVIEFIDAPKVEKVVLTHLGTDELESCIESLRSWKRTQDLILHGCSLEASYTINQILRSLTTAGSESISCPALQRLAIYGSDLGLLGWLMDHAFADLSNCEDLSEQILWRYKHENNTVAVGFEL